jgi:hypothetical protein
MIDVETGEVSGPLSRNFDARAGDIDPLDGKLWAPDGRSENFLLSVDCHTGAIKKIRKPLQCCSGLCLPPARSTCAKSTAGKRSPQSPSLSQLTSPPDKLCSNSRSLRYANSHHIPDGTEVKMCDSQFSNNANASVGKAPYEIAAISLPSADDDAGFLTLEVQFNSLVAELIAAQTTSGELVISPDQRSLVIAMCDWVLKLKPITKPAQHSRKPSWPVSVRSSRRLWKHPRAQSQV